MVSAYSNAVRKLCVILLAIMITISFMPRQQHTYAGENEGDSPWLGAIDTAWYNTSTDTFSLTNGAQLAGLAAIVNGTAYGIARDSFIGKTILLNADVDLNNVGWTPIGTGVVDTTFTWTNPDSDVSQGELVNVTDASAPFDGVFEGNERSVTGLNVDNGSSLCGFFGYLGSNGTIRRLGLEGVVSVSISTGETSDCIGGLVGFNRGTIEHYTGNVAVNAGDSYNVGGVVGFNDGRTGNGRILYAANLGNVIGYAKTGGITGQNAGLVKGSYNAGRIEGRNITSKNGVGGIAGRNGNHNTAVETGRIVDCFNRGVVGSNEQKWVGGITGFQNSLSSIKNTYSIGEIVLGSGYNNPITGKAEGFSDGNNYSLNTLYYFVGSSEALRLAESGIRKTEVEMKSPDFVDELNAGGRSFLPDFEGDAAINDGYPLIRGNQVPDIGVFERIEITKDPSKLDYVSGQKFDLSGFEAYAVYGDGSKEAITDIEIGNTGALTLADNKIVLTLRYGEATLIKEYDVVVSQNALISIDIKTQPLVKIYAEGTSFDPTDLVVTATYSNGSMRDLDSEEYAFTPNLGTPLTTADRKVTVSYSADGVAKTVDVPITVLRMTVPSQNSEGVYEIKEIGDMLWFGAQVNLAGNNAINAILTTDLNLVNAAFSPIGNSTATHQYAGTFDGNGKTLALLIDTSANYSGAFGYVGAAGVVKNLTIAGSVNGGSYTGAVAGQLDGRISHCTNLASVTGNGVYVGGLSGYMNGSATISDAVNHGAITGTYDVGGAVGYSAGTGTLTDIINRGAVTATGTQATNTYGVGGIVGVSTRTATITHNINTGSVRSGLYSTGGVVGYLSAAGSVIGNYNGGTVTGLAGRDGTNIGGVAGRINAESGILRDNYNTGKVSHEQTVGTTHASEIGPVVGFCAGKVSGNFYAQDSMTAIPEGTTGVVVTSDYVSAVSALLSAISNEEILISFGGYPALESAWDGIVRLTLDPDGGVLLGETVVGVKYNATYTPPIPTKAGFTFEGWYLDGNKVTSFLVASKSAFMLVAKWTKEIPVEGNQDGGNVDGKTDGKNSDAGKPIDKPFVKSPAPKISGAAKVGGKLTAIASAWSPNAKFSYQWYQNGKAIKGATKSTYILKKAQLGKKITVKVTGKLTNKSADNLAGSASLTKTSKATAKVKADFKKGTVKIVGTAKVGKKLTAKTAKWSPKPKFSYQWYANGKPIKGATKSTLVLKKAQQGKKITVKVTAKKTYYVKVVKASAKTKKVAKK
jgi:uncharacterized repeat protein (TIGR02543 family)